MHFFRAAHAKVFHTRGGFQIHWSAHELDLRAAPRRCFRDRIAHLPGRAVGDVASWIKVFASRAGRYQNLLSVQIPLRFQRLAYGGDNILLAGQPSRAGRATREVALGGVNALYAASARPLYIFLPAPRV